MFDKSRKYKTAGVIIVFLLVIVFLITNINIKSASSYKQGNADNGYNVISDSASNQTAEGEGALLQQTSPQTTGQEDLTQITEQGSTAQSTEPGASQQTEQQGNSSQTTVKNSTVQTTAQTATQSAASEASKSEQTDKSQADQSDKVQTDRNDKTQSEQTEHIVVTIEIRCDSAVSKKSEIKNEGIKNSIPDDGIILKRTSYSVPKGADVYTLLANAAADNNIPIKASTDKSYVSSINNLAQMMLSQQSGWKYSVNGAVPGVAAKDYKLSDGDAVKWFYVLSIYEGE